MLGTKLKAYIAGKQRTLSSSGVMGSRTRASYSDITSPERSSIMGEKGKDIGSGV